MTWLTTHPLVVSAARFARLFCCDPMVFLGADETDLPVLAAVYAAAAADVDREQREAVRARGR